MCSGLGHPALENAGCAPAFDSGELRFNSLKVSVKICRYSPLQTLWYTVVQLSTTLRQSPSLVHLQNTPARALAALSCRLSPLTSHRAVSITSQRVVSGLSLRTATLGFSQFLEKWKCIGKFEQAKLEAQWMAFPVDAFRILC